MKQSTTLIDCQAKLLEVIGRINRNSEDVKNALEGKTDVILLVGDTGSGKSTVFNLLCGAQFELSQEGIKSVLKIKKGTKNYSEMKHGTKSITTEPKYHYVEEIKHLIIDFPGFRDTRGEIEELVIQLLFNKIVTKNKVKLVYLIQQPLLSLPNRGTFVQEFMKIFKNQKLKFSECILLLNSFALEDKSEDLLIQNVLEELKSITNDPEQKNQKICVIRNINQERLATIPQIRKNVLQQIASAKPIKFSPFEIKNVEVISKYLLKTSKVLSDSIYESLKGEIQVAIMSSDNETLVKLQVILKNLASIKGDQVSQQYQRIFTVYEELTSCFKVKKNIDVQQNASFFKIYHYFEEFKDFIDGYQDCAGNLDKIYDLAQLLYKQIELKLSQSNLEKEKVKQLKQQQAEFQKQYNQMQEKMMQQMEQVRKEEKQMRDEQLQQMKQANELQLQQIQAQIQQQQQQQQNSGGGLFDKILQLAQVVLPVALKFI